MANDGTFLVRVTGFVEVRAINHTQAEVKAVATVQRTPGVLVPTARQVGVDCDAQGWDLRKVTP